MKVDIFFYKLDDFGLERLDATIITNENEGLILICGGIDVIEPTRQSILPSG